MFTLSKSDLTVDSDSSTYTKDSIHTTIENEIMSWCTQKKDDVSNEIENMIKKDFRLQDGIFGSIDACQSQYEPRVMAWCGIFGLSPIDRAFLFGLLHIPVLSILSIFAIPFVMPIGSKAQFADNILENYVTDRYIFNRIKPFMEHAKDKVTHICHVCEIDVSRKITADKIFLGIYQNDFGTSSPGGNCKS
ncbi:unnamed protein product [Mytilus edulis]|uniref:Uncharacterized protein n=1 Tax=Mytilus edulis TaxID=6550 RepID=A0A8S3PYI8_MYTED|nr:unnamed protein product [Mytilus edulis]